LYAKLNRPFPRPYFPPSPTEVSHVVGRGAPLEMTRGGLNQAVHNGPTGRSASGLRGPGSAPTKKKQYTGTMYCLKLRKTTSEMQERLRTAFWDNATQWHGPPWIWHPLFWITAHNSLQMCYDLM
jgi:hypothetical protein